MKNHFNFFNKDIIKFLSLISQVGLTVIAAILISFFSFFYLDKLLHTGGILLGLGLAIGIAAGFLAAYRLIKKFLEDNNE